MKLRTIEGNVVRLRDPVDIFNHFETKEDKLNNFQVIPGGKDGGSADWLSPLPLNAVFIVEDIADQGNFIQLRLRVAYKYEKSVMLFENMAEKPFGIVNPGRFCKRFRMVELMPLEEIAITTEE